MGALPVRTARACFARGPRNAPAKDPAKAERPPSTKTPDPAPARRPQPMLTEPRRVTAHYAAGDGEDGEEQKVTRGPVPLTAL